MGARLAWVAVTGLGTVAALIGLQLFGDSSTAGIVVVGSIGAIATAIAIFAAKRTWDLSVADSDRELSSASGELRHQASHDALTGLPNRAAAVAVLDAQIDQARSGQAIAALVDLDRFRSVNDRYGIPVGDRLLRRAAYRLRAACSANEHLARVGGDEFLITLVDARATRPVAQIIERLTEAFEEPFDLQGVPIQVHVSIGVTSMAIPGADSASLLRDLDLAILDAKQRAGTTTTICSDELRAAASERLEIEAELRTAVENDELDHWVQPIFDAGTGALASAELLLRWQRRRGDAIRPGAFVPIAEVIDMIIPITRANLDAACAAASRWQAAGHRVPIAVNVSVSHIVDGTLVADVRAALQRHRTPPQALAIELTENRLVEHFDAVAPTLLELQALGCRIAIDDFGTGYSSLQYLQRLPADYIKLDRALIQDPVAEAGRHARILSSITDLAHDLGLVVVAEGVESDVHATAIRDAGVDLAQGFGFGAPRPIEDFERELIG